MYRSSRIFSIAAIAVASAISAAGAFAHSAYDRAASLARAVVHAVVDVFAVESPFHPGQAVKTEQSLGLVMAKAFKRRIEGRDRPTVTPRWRMCPSA